MQYYRNTSYLMLKTGILSDGFYIFIKNDTDGSGLAILNESAMPIYIESSLNSLKTSQRVVIIRPSEASNVFEMKDFSGKDLKHQKDMKKGFFAKNLEIKIRHDLVTKTFSPANGPINRGNMFD